jgi:hypothetical protein
MSIFAVLSLIILALAVNILWYWLKNDLQNKGYETHTFYGHFNDLFNANEVIKNTDDSVTRRTYRKILYSIIAMVVLIPVIFFTNMPTFESNRCRQFNRYVDHQVTSIVKSKFIDKYNHASETLELSNGTHETKVTSIVLELYGYLQPNDSIAKISGNNELKVYRNGNERTFNVDRSFWCKD